MIAWDTAKAVAVIVLAALVIAAAGHLAARLAQPTELIVNVQWSRSGPL
jgi:hypothetical protein